ncbi:amino acid transporter-like protein [Tricladium varicosporioides]|nr:amino acid transporter-like protein [Hymenoscyphus varicosporioides]
MPTNQNRTVDESNLPATSIFRRTGDHAVIDHQADSDEEILVALGYKQEFKRDFSIWSSFSVSFSCLGLIPSIASTLGYNLGYSGTAGSVWGWIVAGSLIQCVALSMAELCSSMPTAGGLYYASAVLAPEGWGPLFSWITGWSNFLGLITAPCAVNFALAAMILTAAQITHPDYEMKTYHVYLLLLALLGIQGLITMNSTKFIARFNEIGAVFNLVIVFIFIIWLPAGSINSPKTNPNDVVWTSEGIINGTEWPTGFAFLMGFLSVIWTLAGYDTPFHLSEECSNANIAGPRAIFMTAQSALYLGFAVVLVIAYTVKDIQDVVAGPYGQPMGSLCLQVLGRKAGLAMFSLNMVAQFFVGQGIIVAASRVTFAYSRDGALPFSRWLKIVNKHTKTPANAIWAVIFIGALLGLLMFASPAAIGAVFSMGAIGQYVAFTTPIALKLFVAGDKFRPGPWNLGRFSKPVGAVACAFVALMIPVLCFPPTRGGDLNPLNMNYACLIWGGSMFLSLVWYAIDARKWFKGPKINVEHLIHVPVFEAQSKEPMETQKNVGVTKME